MSTLSDANEQPAETGTRHAELHARGRSTRARGLLIVAALGASLGLSILVALFVGRSSSDAGMQALFLGMRGYRVGVAFFSGAALAVGGAIVQGLFRNPLASPQILGTNAGALVGGKVALYASFMFFGGRSIYGIAPEMVVPFGCVVGAVLSLAAVLSVTSLHANIVTLLLTGYVLNGLFLSMSTMITSLSGESFELARAMSSFSTGSLSGAGQSQVLLSALMVLAGSLPALFWSGSLDLLLSGEEEALSLGVEVARVRFWCVVWASLATAGAVAVGGNVGFIGIIVPHFLRRYTGPAHRYLLPASFVAGGAFLILCDALCRAFPFRTELPLGVLVELLGAPAFLWLLRSLGREQAHG